MEIELMHPADKICQVMKRVYDRGLTSLTGGNLSIMDEEGVMWVTPSGIDKGTLTREDIVKVFSDGSWEGKHKPTSEYRIHKRIYEVCPEMKAVVHAHAPGLVTMSILYEKPDPWILADSCIAFKKTGLARYATPGTMDLVESVEEEFSKGHDFAVLKNHAAFAGSRIGLEDAFCRFEQMEFLARIQCITRWLGKMTQLEEKDISLLTESQESAETFIPEYHSSKERELRRELKAFVRRSYEKALFTGMCGTMSLKLDEKRFLISPRYKDNGRIEEEDFVLIEDGCAETGKEPSVDWRIHQAIYKKNPGLNCIMFGTPVYSSAYAVSQVDFPLEIAPEVYGVLRGFQKMTVEEYADPDRAAEILTEKNPFALIQNKGVLVAGPTVTLTFDKMEVAESSAWSLVMAAMYGDAIHPLTMEQLKLTDIHD